MGTPNPSTTPPKKQNQEQTGRNKIKQGKEKRRTHLAHAPVPRERARARHQAPRANPPPELDLLDCFWKAHAAVRGRLCIILVRSSEAPRHANAGTSTYLDYSTKLVLLTMGPVPTG